MGAAEFATNSRVVQQNTFSTVKRLHILLLALGTAALVWGGYRIYRAHANLVTLHVRAMDVRQAISRIEWQTWERILVHKDVAGTVTLDVSNVPLDEVLNIIALQSSARWTRLYPIFRTGKAAVDFKKVVRGDTAIEGSGWTNLQKNPFWLRNTIGGFGNTARAANNLVSAQILNKDLDFTALALSRFSQAQIVPEDTAHGNITLKLAQVPFEKAVAQVAKQVHRNWDEIYALQSVRAPTTIAKAPNTVIAHTNTIAGDTNPPPPVMVKLAATPPPPQRPPEQQMEAFFATMTPEERQKAEEQIAAAQQLQSLPPAERQQKMQEMAAQTAQASQADTERRIQERLRNGTVEQRVEHDRQQVQKRQQRTQKQ